MADCNFQIRRTPLTPGGVKDGGEETFVADPVGPTCRVQIYLRVPTDTGTKTESVHTPTGSAAPDIGDFHISGISANHVTLKAKSNSPAGTLIMKMTCTEPACGPTERTIDFIPPPPMTWWEKALFVITSFFSVGIIGAAWGWFIFGPLGAPIGFVVVGAAAAIVCIIWLANR